VVGDVPLAEQIIATDATGDANRIHNGLLAATAADTICLLRTFPRTTIGAAWIGPYECCLFVSACDGLLNNQAANPARSSEH
jgi:hypothetical protein